jgi:chromosome segregation ATPase
LSIFAEKEALEQIAKQLSIEGSATNDESEKDRNLEILQDQLKHLEEEKKYLNEKIHDFEHETAGLARMFGMQQEKFEYEIKNKDKIIKAIEKERKRLEEELETTRNDLGKLKNESESGNELVENLKTSIHVKDEEVLNLSHLHDDAKKLLKEIEEKLTVSDENLRKERSKNKVLEENTGSYMDNIEALSEENRHLNTEINHLRNAQRNVSQEKSQVEKEIQKLNDQIECLQNKLQESARNHVKLEVCNAKLKQDKNDKESEIRKLEKKDVDLRTDIEKLKKEIVLVEDQKHALESKMSLVQAEMKNLERLRERLEQELFDSHKRLEKAEENLERRTIEKGKLEEEVQALEQVINDLMIKNRQENECLEKAEENLENETKEKEKLEEAVRALDQVINDLTKSIKQQNNYLEETKRELDTVIATKQQLLLEVEKLENANKDLKIKINTLSQDIENVHGVCETKAKKLEDLERTLNEKSRIILSHENKEKELQNRIEELLNMDEIGANELKIAREEITKLRKENANIEENYEKTTVQFQECLQELSKKNEMYMKSRTHNEKQVEELTRFRELNAEINDELRNRNDEIGLLTMEKDELQRVLASKRNLIEKDSLMQSNLNKEVESMKIHIEKCKENEKETFQKLSEAKRKHETAIRHLDNERDEKNDLELQLKYSREKVERWKKLSFEIKDERNRLQMQIAELDRNLNEKHSNLAEEKSSLEKEMGTLKNIVKRLKSNEENLRWKIEELRDEVDKLSDVNSEQEMESRKLSHEKERMMENFVRLKSVAEENAALQNECKEINCERIKLNNDVDTLQDKARNVGDENERLQKELKILQDQFDIMQERLLETTQECKQLKNECNIVKDNTSELMEEKERLFNENCRLKEKKNSTIQDRNKLQDMIESLDKCHSEKNDALSRQIALLENELASRRSEIKRCEEKESKLLNEIQELNEKTENSMEENDKINGLLKKTDGENIRLRKKVADLAKLVEQIEQERESRINLETELNGREKLLNKYKTSKKKLNDLISTLYRQQNELKDELRNKEREHIDLNDTLETERSDKLKCKDVIGQLEEELKTTKTRVLKCINEMQNEKEKNEQAELALTRIKKERNDFKEISRRNEYEYNRKIKGLESETRELLDNIEMLQNENDEAKLCNVNLDIKIQNLEEEMRSLTETKSQLVEKLKKKDEQFVDIAKENNTLTEENKRLQEHAENIDVIISLQNSAALDQASGMEKEIKILHDTLAQVQNTRDINRSEIDELRRNLKTANEDRINTEVKLNDNRLERERLESKTNELLSNCARLENLVKEGVQLRLEKEDKERLLESAQQTNRVLDVELAGKTREISEKEQVLENLKEDICDYKETIEKLDASKKGLIASVEELTQINDEGLKECKLKSDKNEQLLLEKNRLTELVVFHKDEMENLKRETDEMKTELQFKIQEAENDKFQLQSDVNMKEENLHRLTEKNNELQESLKNVKEEVDDLENENEDFLAEAEQLKEVNKKAKEALYTLQSEHSVLQEELREKENSFNEERGKVSLEIFKMETDITNLNGRLTQANERNEKQRELEKMLRLEIDELSDGYVEFEEEVQHRNDENLSLKEKLQTFLQNIEELELARDTACLLKEKRHCELLNSEKNVQRLEKHLKEKQKTNKKLQKELDSVVEKENFLELQISAEKELSGQRLNQIQDLQNLQRKVDEQLWKAKRDTEKLGTEIETWRTSSDSMKVRIETLEDELNKTANEKQMVSELYEETKKISETKAEQIRKLKSNFSEKTAGFEAIIGEMNNEKSDFNQTLNDLEKLLEKKSVEIASSEEIVEVISNKYEDSLLVTLSLHNDIQRKDERIAELEERKKQVTNLLTDLDLKIAEIQVQAKGLETDNEFLRQQLTRAITSNENLRKKLEDEQRLFAEKYEKSSREIQYLQEMKDHFVQLALEANGKIEDQNSALMQLQADYEKLISDKYCLNNTKVRLENELWETKSQEEKLKQTLNIEKEKTDKQSLEIEHLLKDCESLMAKRSLASEEHKETEKKLMKTNAVCQELEDFLEERNAEILKIREQCKNWKDKANQIEESLSVSTAQNEKLLQIKNEEIRSLTAANKKLKNMIDEVKSDLDEQTARNNINEFENKNLKEKLEQKQERFNDLEVLYKNTMNSKDSLEVEKKGLLTKIKTTSRNLETLKIARQQLTTENKELNGVVKAKEKELEERCNSFRMAEQKLDEEISDHKTTVENLLVENSDLRQKLNVRNTQLKETKISLEEISRKLEDQEKENKRLNSAIKNLNFERNCLADVNLKVSDALGKLKNESGRKQTQQEKKLLESDKNALDEHGESDFSWQSKEVYSMKSFELQNNFLQVENEIHTLRSLVSNKENEITRLEVSLDLLQNEMDVQCSQVSNYKKKFEDECKRRENALEITKQLEADLEHLKEEKYSIATESQQKLMYVQHELLANELVICDLRGKNGRLEDKIREIKASNEEKTEQIKKLENVEKTRIRELEAVEKIMEKTLLQILNLEQALYACEIEQNDLTILYSGENNRIDRYDELSSTLMHRFERVLENIQSQLRKAKKLGKDLTDAETQSSIYRAKLQALEIAYKNLKVECEQLHNQLSLVTSSRDEALCKAAELSESLLTAEANVERTKILQSEENSKIAQELQKMQRELTLACEKFNCSISKARSLEEKIVTKEKRIADLEESLKISGINDRMLQIKVAELETTTEILFNTNKELENAEKESEEKIATLQFGLQQEKVGRSEDIAERAATIRQLELKNENLERQIVRSKELLTRTEKTTKGLQKQIETLQCRYKESETACSTEIADCQSTILELQQSILNLEEDTIRLRNDSCALARTNEHLLDNIANVEKENKDHRNILKQNKQEKEIQNKRLEKVFDVTLNEEVSNDINDQSRKLERAIEVIKDLKRCKENVLKLKRKNEEIHMQCQTNCKDHELLKEHSSELTVLVKNLENDLDRSKVKCKQLNTKVQELEENVETLKVNEDQQQYQYHVLEKEKEDLENEVICIEEGTEKLIEKLNESVHLLHDFDPNTTSGNLDDSGIGTEDNSVQIMSSREQLDSGVFSPGFDNSITFPPNYKSEDEKVGNEKMRQLETAVNTCVQIMSKVGPAFNEKSKFFSIKEQQLIEEIRVLTEASVQNEDMLSSLEEEVERLELSQKSLQETYQEKDVNLKECQMKLEHSITIANEKEMSIMILNESVQEYRKQQESLEKELTNAKMGNEQLNKEKLQPAITIQDYERAFEEHRQQCLESDAENEKRTKRLRLKITELENHILEKQNAHLELQNVCTTLRGTVNQLNNREKEYSLTVTSYQDQVQDLEKQKREDTKQMEELSQELDNRKETIMTLETMCQETQASVNELNKKLQKASTDHEESCKEVIYFKEKIIHIKLERDSLIDDAKIRKEHIKQKKSTIEHISSELREKDEILRKSETKLKLVEELLQEINKTKDNLEKDINEIKDENTDLRKQIELLKNENKCFLERLKKKEEEIIEKDKLNYEFDKDNKEMKCELLANNGALKEAIDELRMSLAEAKRINNVIEDLNHLFDSNAGHNCSTTDCQEGMDTYNKILLIGRKMNNVSLVYQKIVVERESLQKNVEEKVSLLQNERSEKSTLEREKQHLDETVSALSKAFAEVKLSLRKQEQELDQNINELSTEKKSNDELHNVNLSLQEQVKMLEDNVLSISTHAESLKVDRKNLKESFMKAQNQMAKLNSKYDQLNALNEELRAAKNTINELNNLQDKTITAKEDAEKELEYTQKRLADLESSQTGQIKLLSDTRVTLTQERERIVTLTKLARMKERDLENAKMAIKLKDELIGQMKEQIEEMKDTSSSTKEELANTIKQLTTVQQRKEILSNEKVCKSDLY